MIRIPARALCPVFAMLNIVSAEQPQEAVHHISTDQAPSPNGLTEIHATQLEPTPPLEACINLADDEIDSSVRYAKVADMSLDELYKARKYYLWSQNIDAAIKTIERILIRDEQQHARAYHMLEVGDLYMLKERYTMAQSVFDTFIQQFPGSNYLGYAYYRKILCHYYNMLEPDKDQEATRNMIAEADTYLQLFPRGKHVHDTQELKHYGYTVLCQCELFTCNVYIGKSTWSNRPASALRAAYYRLKYLYDTLSDKLPQKQAHAVRSTLAQALQTIHIDQLDDANTDAQTQIYQQLIQAHDKVDAALETDTSRSWFVNPLRRF